jgi:quercetin dioxygenase-like cupin family protein
MTEGAPSGNVLTASWGDLPIEAVQPGVTRQVLSGDQQTVIHYHYAPGSVFPEHHHPQEQVTVVLSGLLEFAIAGRQHQLAPGDLIIIPGGVPHGARVLGDVPVESINTLSPRRDVHPGR